MNIANKYELTLNENKILIKNKKNHQVTLSKKTFEDFLDFLLLSGSENHEINKYFRLSLLDLDEFLKLPGGQEMFCLGLFFKDLNQPSFASDFYTQAIISFHYIFNHVFENSTSFLTLEEFHRSNTFFNQPSLIDNYWLFIL